MDLDDKTATNALQNSVLIGKSPWTFYNGNIYEFKYDNAGGWHGYKATGGEAPPEFLKGLLDTKQVTKSQYKRLIKDN